MKLRNASWIVKNGSGWNKHKTADTLTALLADEDAETLPQVPAGYAVIVAPISDKPLGLRCALVRELERKMEPFLSFHEAGGDYLSREEENKIIAGLGGRELDNSTMEAMEADLTALAYTPTPVRPSGWPDGNKWFFGQDGTWASIEMLDDGPEGEADGWVRDVAGVDAEVVKACRCDQQDDDASGFFIRVMSEAIAKIIRP